MDLCFFFVILLYRYRSCFDDQVYCEIRKQMYFYVLKNEDGVGYSVFSDSDYTITRQPPAIVLTLLR